MAHTKSMEKYTPSSLCEHKCLNEKLKKEYIATLTKEQREKINELLITKNQNSALYKHISGRHEPVISEENNNTLDINNTNKLEAIVSVQPSNSMLNLSRIPPNQPEKECCAQFLNSLKVNTKSVCEETFKSKASWKKERQFRVTGSRCYALYTYTKNKAPNWEQKLQQYFYLKAFKKTAAIKHGIKYEPSARTVYYNYTGIKVKQIGLVVPQINPWLGYSSDGVILDENKKSIKLIKIG